MNPAFLITRHVRNAREARRLARAEAGTFSATMRRNYALHEMEKARHLKRLGDRAIPADDYYGHPPGCPDGDYCLGNRVCFWGCDDNGED